LGVTPKKALSKYFAPGGRGFPFSRMREKVARSAG
jgi:hypothetical protein